MLKLKDIIAFRDPFILADEKNKTYYMWGTSANPFDGKKQGFIYYKSKDLKDWQGPFNSFRGDNLSLPQQDFWAPEVFKVGEKYFMFATFGEKDGYRRTQILAADKLENEFKIVGQATPKDIGCLDATLYFEDGEYYSIYCREWITNFADDLNGYIQYAKVKSDFSGIDENTVRQMFKATDSPVWGGGKIIKVTDACFMHRTASQLFMLWSTFDEKDNYVWTYCYSDNGRLDGNWIHSKEALFENDGGHGMVFEDFEGKLHAVFHQPNSGNIESPKIYDFDDSEINKLRIKI